MLIDRLHCVSITRAQMHCHALPRVPFIALILVALSANLATAARSLDRNSALIGWSEELSTQRIVLTTEYGKVCYVMWRHSRVRCCNQAWDRPLHSQ
jgi:hypothetical protein